ncbi:ABC transporter permease [Alteromonas gilva]|uniref:ABC transporter permease n=1 Tax=Alteromonas gilva TaxID=2987522 RepID=A0ABT5L576_9ALTE|nr:ABC transporter permease [Alteromonas gilva]MDC8831549.1 ABC transporter permease [Alteromonas gilva]
MLQQLNLTKIRLLVADAWHELLAQKLRTFLTLLGMIFGVGAVIAMLNIGKGAEQEALKMIGSMGLQNLIVESKRYSAEELRDIREDSLGLNAADVAAAMATLPFIASYSGEKQIKLFALYSDFAKADATAVGVTSSYFELASMAPAKGRLLTANDELRVAQVAVLGADVAAALFPDAEPLGQFVKINHAWFEVVGVIAAPTFNKDAFQGVKINGDRNRVFIPLSTSQKKLNSEPLASELDVVKFEVTEDYSTVLAAKAVTQLLDQRHAGVEDYRLIIPVELLAQQENTQRIFNIVMACVAGISLLVGGIGIMNIMLANVLERTKEIGLLRAVGATQQDIKLQFIAESFVISVLGGVLGIVFGLVLSEIIGFYSEWAVSWSLTAIVLSVSICLLVGVGFGVFPAIKASKLNPIDALHSD